MDEVIWVLRNGQPGSGGPSLRLRPALLLRRERLSLYSLCHPQRSTAGLNGGKEAVAPPDQEEFSDNRMAPQLL